MIAVLVTAAADMAKPIRRTKAEQIESYFRTMRNQVEVLSEDTLLIDAMIDFSKAFRALRSELDDKERLREGCSWAWFIFGC